jgi:hypothetical protein
VPLSTDLHLAPVDDSGLVGGTVVHEAFEAVDPPESGGELGGPELLNVLCESVGDLSLNLSLPLFAVVAVGVIEAGAEGEDGQAADDSADGGEALGPIEFDGDGGIRWARRSKSSQALALRSKIVLACAEGLPGSVVAADLGVAAKTVGKWRRRFVADRLDGLVDEPRPGRPATITVDQVEDVVVATLEQIPKNATHWSRASMAKRSGLSPSTIGRIWKSFELNRTAVTP